MASRGRVVMPGCVGGKSKKKYKCNSTGCTVTPQGKDLPRHYLAKTNWDLLAKLRAAMGDSEVEELLKETDPHTEFIYRRNYTKTRLPEYRTHVRVKEVVQHTVLDIFFQVSWSDSG